MPTHSELAVRLLKDAAEFFRKSGAENPPIKKQMDDNAALYDQVAALLSANPKGQTGERSNADMACALLTDAASFFRALGQQNQPIEELMTQNAETFEHIGALVRLDPIGIID